MNPLKSITGTIVSGVVLAVIFIFLLGGGSGPANPWEIWVWVHVLVGITWIGLLYYFNFVQIPAMPAAKADGTAPGITKHVAPRALLWFRWSALATWFTGVAALEAMYHAVPDVEGSGFVAAFTFQAGYEVIGMGAWLGTIMLLNVWGLIWPNQKKILGLVEATDEAKAKAAVIALMASRTNTLLSIPMILAMTAQGHGLPF